MNLIHIHMPNKDYKNALICAIMPSKQIGRTKDVSTVERRPLLDGRHMIMILAPKAEKATFAEKKARKANEAAGEKAPEAQE